MPKEHTIHRDQRGAVFRTLLDLDVEDTDARAELETLGIEPSYHNAICFAVVKKAANGDMNAYKLIREAAEDATDERRPIRAMDLTALSDEQLERLADLTDEGCV